MVKKIVLVLILIGSVLACDKSENNGSIVQKEPMSEPPKEVEPIGNLLFRIDVPSGYVRKGIDKLHIVLYDAEDNVLDYKTHSSGEVETLSFYSEEALLNTTDNFSLSFIYNFKDEIFSSRIYKDLNYNMLSTAIELAPKALGSTTKFIDIPIIGQESRWDLRSSGRGYSIIGINERYSGNYSSDLLNNLGLDMAYIQYYNVDNIYDYKYLYMPTKELGELNNLNVDMFSSDNVRSGSIRIDAPFENAYLQIYGYENEDKFKAGSGHRLCFNPALLDFNGIYYYYADIFSHTKHSIQFKNYEFEGVGSIPTELSIPETSIDYTYEDGTISYTGLEDYEVSRFYLRNQGGLYMTTVIVADGLSTQISIPEIPIDLLGATIQSQLQVSNLEMVQAAAENYDGFDSFSEYITNTLGKSEPYYLNATQRERIWKSSVSTNLLPF